MFFDRDGVLNQQPPDVRCPDDLELLPGAADAVRLVNAADRLAVVVTNQPLIAKGLMSLDDLARVHDRLETLLGQGGAKLDRIYFCPHHPDAGFAGERAELKVVCDCRKPSPGMVIRAAADLPIALERSCVIGDSWRDAGLARNAGIAAYGVRTGRACRDGPPDIAPDRVFDDVLHAVRFALTVPQGPER